MGIGPDKTGADLPPGKYKICRVPGVLYYRRVRLTPYTVGAATCRPPGQKKKADLKRNRLLVDTKGVEPSTSAMRMQHSPN